MRATARAEATLGYARKEHDRTERLAKEGLVSERDVALARRDEDIALGEVNAAKLFSGSQLGAPSPAGGLRLTAPVAGTVVSVEPTPAGFAERGAVLFRVVDLEHLWIELRIPEADLPRVRTPTGLCFEWDGAERKFEVAADALVAVGGAVDPRTRTAPLIFEFDNREPRLAVGTAVRARIFTAAPTKTLGIPVAAVVDDGGNSVVFAQVDGEAFERRPVALGIRDGDWVQVLAGVTPGERIVTRGAYAIRLASASGSLPAHGHVH